MYDQAFVIAAIQQLPRKLGIYVGVSLIQDQCFNIINDIYIATPQNDSRSHIIAQVTKIADDSIKDLGIVKVVAQAAKDPELDLELRTEISTTLGYFSVGIKQHERGILEAQKENSHLKDKEIDEARYSMAKIVENANKFILYMKEDGQKADEKKKKK